MARRGSAEAAESVLARHGELADAPALRAALALSTDYHSMSSLVGALGRLPEAGPFPELSEIYAASVYSYTRARAVQAMAATDPEFSNRWATECLWDCEQDVRVAGARFAPLEWTVVARLQELADDGCEVDEVRDAARTRWTATAT